MPLHKIGSSHKCAVFAGSPVIVPEIEVHKIRGLREPWTAKRPVFAQSIHNVLRYANAIIGGLDRLFGLAVDPVDQYGNVALGTDLFHLRLGCGIVRTFFAHGICQINRTTVPTDHG